MKQKQVQISIQLLSNLFKYHLLECDAVLPDIEKGLNEKFEAMILRDLYQKSKNAPSEKEREEARKQYLDRKGIPLDYRW